MNSVVKPLLIIAVVCCSNAHHLSSEDGGQKSIIAIAGKANDSVDSLSSFMRRRRSTVKQTKFVVDLTDQVQPNECFPPILSFLVNGRAVYSNSTVRGTIGQNNISVQLTVADTYFPTTTAAPINFGNRFYLSEQQLSYYGAQQDCHNRNMELVSIADETKRAEVYRAMSGKGRNYLTSAQKKFSTWYWAGDVPITYFYEHNNVRSVTSQDCIEVCQYCGGMIDKSCHAAGFYMCEQLPPKPVDTRPPTINIYVDSKLVFHETGSDSILDFIIFIDTVNSVGTNSAYTLINTTDGNQQKLISSTSNGQSEDSNGVSITVTISNEVLCPEPTTTTTATTTTIATTDVTTTDIPEPEPKTYFFSPGKGTYESAIEFCKNQSMQLVRIQSNEKNVELQKYIMEKDRNNYYWTSGYRSQDTKEWYWANDTKVSFFKWVPGEPNNKGGNENCIELLRSNYEAKWNDQECED